MAGMRARVALNPAVSVGEEIQGVQNVDGEAADESSHVGLCFEYENDEELDLWRNLNIGDEVIELVDKD